MSHANMSTCDAAMHYLELGLSVTALNGKVPAIPWKEFQVTPPTPAQIGVWFPPQTARNIGLLCGRVSGIVVIDTDSQAASEFWETEFPETSLIVRTGGDAGGKHFYYRYPMMDTERIHNRVDVQGLKIDVRADGGIVLAPGSRHPETGRRYVAEKGVLDRDALQSLPPFDPAWIPKPTPPQNCTLPNLDLPATEARLMARKYISHIHSIENEGGDRNCFRAACKLVQTFGLSPDEALQELILWNQSNADPPWEVPALEHKIREAIKRR